jgi:uncharacterized protein
MAERTHEKTTKDHVARLIEEYHEVNRAIHRVETGEQRASDEVVEGLKRRRRTLRDEMAQILAETDAAA